MQKVALVVNNRYLDLFENEDLSLQFGTNDIFNPESVIINYSKTFSIPATKNNKIAFNFEDNLNSENTIRRFNARLEIDNIIQYEGLLEINSISKVKGNIQYNCNFFTNELSFFESIETKGLDELDLKVLEHSATTTFVQGSFSGNSDNYNVCYGMVDWGILSYSGSTGVFNRNGLANQYPNNGLFINYNLYPFPYVKIIFEKIFEENNWELVSNFVNEDYFKRLLFVWKYGTPNFSLNSFSTNTKTTWLNLRGRLGTDISVGLPSQLRIRAYTSDTDLTGTVVATSTGFTTNLIFNYTVPSGYTYYITEVNYASGPGWVALQNSTPTNAEAYSVKNFGDTDLMELVDGNRIYLPDTTQSYSFEQTVVVLAGPIYSANLLDNNRNIVYNYKKLLPNLEIYNQKDFILDIAKMFNLYFSFDFKTRKVFVEPRDGFYINNVLDWSNKVDVSEPIEISYLNSGTFSFQLQDFESDYYTPLVNNITNLPALEPLTFNYRKIIDDSRNEVDFNLSVGQTRFNLSGLPNNFRVSGATGTIIFPQHYYFNANNITENNQVIDVESVEPILIERPRFLFNNGLSNMTADTFVNIGLHESNLINSNTINRLPTISVRSNLFNDGNQFALTFNDLRVVDGLQQNFNGLYKKFYSNLFDNSNRIRIINCKMVLNSLDIYTLDVRDLVYLNINGEGGLYTINNISNYNPGSNSLTDVQLLKVINSSLPPNITNPNDSEIILPPPVEPETNPI